MLQYWLYADMPNMVTSNNATSSGNGKKVNVEGDVTAAKNKNSTKDVLEPKISNMATSPSKNAQDTMELDRSSRKRFNVDQGAGVVATISPGGVLAITDGKGGDLVEVEEPSMSFNSERAKTDKSGDNDNFSADSRDGSRQV